MSESLLTVRDYLRHAVSEFRRAELFFGHGASNAIDEAAFLILEALALPIDDINPWLDARLTPAERQLLSVLIEARKSTRKPVSYLVNKAYIRGAPFYVDERVIVPRSFIGELLDEGAVVLPAPKDVHAALDLCTGSGCLAILAALAFPDSYVHAVDISSDALEVARRNVDDYGLADRVTLHRGDVYAPVGDQKFDLILANPPYVDAEAMNALPPEYRAEPALALAGGDDGLDIVRRIIDGAHSRLNRGGGLLCEIGTGRELLERVYPSLPFTWLDTQESSAEVFWLSREDLIRNP